ncbi:hypothetical protein CMK12_08165 [Candidatus Poribacteria bacterium]|nr:hypothetical protein [Candidatus Poribacteria bacterium]
MTLLFQIVLERGSFLVKIVSDGMARLYSAINHLMVGIRLGTGQGFIYKTGQTLTKVLFQRSICVLSPLPCTAMGFFDQPPTDNPF